MVVSTYYTPTIIIKKDNNFDYFYEGNREVCKDDFIFTDLNFININWDIKFAIEEIKKNINIVIYKNKDNIEFYLSLFRENNESLVFEVVKIAKIYDIIKSLNEDNFDIKNIEESLDYNNEYISNSFENFVVKYPKIRGIKKIIKNIFKRGVVYDKDLSITFHEFEGYTIYTINSNPLHTITCLKEGNNPGIISYFLNNINEGEVRNYYNLMYVYKKGDIIYIIDKIKNVFSKISLFTKTYKIPVSIKGLKIDKEIFEKLINIYS